MKTQTTKYFQVCFFSGTGKEKTVIKTETLEAESLQAAVEHANATFAGNEIRIYPLVDVTDGETIIAMAEFTLASFENWERRNNYAVENPQNRSFWEKEDLLSTAQVAILETLNAEPDANMFTVKSKAFSAIRNAQAEKERVSERTYNPGWTSCNITPRGPRPTCPAVDRLLTQAVDEVADTLAPEQAKALMMSYHDGLSASEIAEKTGKNRTTIYRNLYRAYHWTLKKAQAIDASGDIFKTACITETDIADALASLRKRGHMNKADK